MCFRMSKFFNMPKSQVKFKVEESVKIHVEPVGVKDTNVGGSTVKMTLDRVNIKANMQKKGKECRQNLKTSALQNPAEGKPRRYVNCCKMEREGIQSCVRLSPWLADVGVSWMTESAPTNRYANIFFNEKSSYVITRHSANINLRN